jgi:hypothetical protein
MRISVKSVSIGELYIYYKIHPIVRFDTWNIGVHQADPISGGRGVEPVVQKAHNKWSVPYIFRENC